MAAILKEKSMDREQRGEWAGLERYMEGREAAEERGASRVIDILAKPADKQMPASSSLVCSGRRKISPYLLPSIFDPGYLHNCWRNAV